MRVDIGVSKEGIYKKLNKKIVLGKDIVSEDSGYIFSDEEWEYICRGIDSRYLESEESDINEHTNNVLKEIDKGGIEENLCEELEENDIDDYINSASTEIDEECTDWEVPFRVNSKDIIEIENNGDVEAKILYEDENNSIVEESKEDIYEIKESSSNYDLDKGSPTYKSLREYIKKNSGCTISDASKYFSRKEITKQLNKGVIFAKNNVLYV